MSFMHERFNFYQNNFGSRNTYYNVQQASTSHRNLAHILLLKSKGIASSIDINHNELQMYCFSIPEDLVTLSQL